MEFYAPNILNSMSGKVCIGGAGEHFEFIRLISPKRHLSNSMMKLANGARQAEQGERQQHWHQA
jgi:hypothetical protein